MKYLALLLAIVLLASCSAIKQPKLPPGSYAYGEAGYNQDSGGHAEAGVHIPLYQK